jgi:ArsR family transcriptional regulator
MEETEMTQTQFNRIARALADPQRFAILKRIAGSKSEVACKTIVAELTVTPATISHHLKELAIADLVRARKEGQVLYLTARRDVLADYLREIERRLLGAAKSK